MGCCHLHSSTPQILSRIPTNKPSQLSLFSSAQPKFRINNQNQNQQPPPISTTTVTQRQPPIPETDAYSVKFRTLRGCKLGISRYPDFEYNAEGGTGSGTGLKIVDGDLDGEVSVNFDLETLYIPSLTSATTRFLGLPLPPFLKIDIVPELFRGIINQKSGKVDLEFKAKFLFSIGSIYKAPPLLVETVLTSEESKGTLRSGKGESLNEEGKCRLVGVATVDPIDDFLMDTFLRLPTECLANMNATISFSSSSRFKNHHLDHFNS